MTAKHASRARARAAILTIPAKTIPARTVSAKTVPAVPDEPVPAAGELIQALCRLAERQLERLERAKPKRRANYAKFWADQARALDALVRLLEPLFKLMDKYQRQQKRRQPAYADDEALYELERKIGRLVTAARDDLDRGR